MTGFFGPTCDLFEVHLSRPAVAVWRMIPTSTTPSSVIPRTSFRTVPIHKFGLEDDERS